MGFAIKTLWVTGILNGIYRETLDGLRIMVVLLDFMGYSWDKLWVFNRTFCGIWWGCLGINEQTCGWENIWYRYGKPILYWLVVWNMAFIFPYIGNDNPNWFSYFSEGLKPPTSISCMAFWMFFGQPHGQETAKRTPSCSCGKPKRSTPNHHDPPQLPPVWKWATLYPHIHWFIIMFPMKIARTWGVYTQLFSQTHMGFLKMRTLKLLVSPFKMTVWRLDVSGFLRFHEVVL